MVKDFIEQRQVGTNNRNCTFFNSHQRLLSAKVLLIDGAVFVYRHNTCRKAGTAEEILQ